MGCYDFIGSVDGAPVFEPRSVATWADAGASGGGYAAARPDATTVDVNAIADCARGCFIYICKFFRFASLKFERRKNLIISTGAVAMSDSLSHSAV